jgi:hypothetical protein
MGREKRDAIAVFGDKFCECLGNRLADRPSRFGLR